MQRVHDKAGLNHVKWQYRKWLQNRNCHFESLWSVYLQLLDFNPKISISKESNYKMLAGVASPSPSFPHLEQTNIAILEGIEIWNTL